jgi:hypothetical protein
MTLGDHCVKGNDLVYKLSLENETMICFALREHDSAMFHLLQTCPLCAKYGR